MKRFPINFTQDLWQWLTESRAGHGFATTSSFIRHIVIKFKNQEANQKWTDADMLEWGKRINNFLAIQKESYVLQDREIVIRKEFEQFKKTRA